MVFCVSIIGVNTHYFVPNERIQITLAVAEEPQVVQNATLNANLCHACMLMLCNTLLQHIPDYFSYHLPSGVIFVLRWITASYYDNRYTNYYTPMQYGIL
jgi:hypothetical protein